MSSHDVDFACVGLRLGTWHEGEKLHGGKNETIQFYCSLFGQCWAGWKLHSGLNAVELADACFMLVFKLTLIENLNSST